ncbi:MAG: ribonuclease HII [Candidatus Paceibacterota bacterium]|jgi:ribonuclease HII
MLTKKDKKTKLCPPDLGLIRGLAGKVVIGIDEAGRGALAGPVSVGAVAWEIKDWPKLKKELIDYPVGKDSKKLTAKQRDFWFAKIEELEEKGLLSFTQAFSSNKVIDKKGINFAIREGIAGCLGSLEGNPLKASQGLPSGLQSESLVLLDGGLKAPPDWVNQQTIIKGDEKELVISLASIVAKVLRDREMIKLGKKYPNHYLHKHKGYGTKLHYEKITEFGVLIIHRETYLGGTF